MRDFVFRRGLLPALLLVVAAGLAVRPAAATEITPVTSPGGLTAWLVQEPSIPVIALRFAFRGGAALDPEDRAGLSYMVSGLLDEGAGTLDSQAFRTRLEELAVRLSFDSGRDLFSGSLQTLSANREEAFGLLRQALTAPRFDEEPIARIRRQIQASLMREQERPHRIAAHTLYRNLFGAHPYGRPRKGTPESIERIDRADLLDFVATRLTRDRLVIGVVGDITPEKLGPALDEIFGALPAQSPLPDIPEAEVAATGRTIVIEKAVPQSAIYLGGPGLRRDDPDWYTAYLLNYVLGGGGLTSRLNDSIREQRGLAYSVGSYLVPFEQAGLFMGTAGSNNASAGEVVSLFRAELERIRKDGISAEELASAKTYINGSFPLRLTSSGRIASLLVAIQRSELGIDYIDRRPGYYEAITQADVKRVAGRLLDPEKLTVVVVGQPKGLSPDG